MLYYNVQTSEINLWWDARADFKRGYKYSLSLDGKFVGKTKKIFFDFKFLKPNTEYLLGLTPIDCKGKKIDGEQTIKVKTAFRRRTYLVHMNVR